MQPQIGFVSILTSGNILRDLKFAIENHFEWLEIALDWPHNFNLPNSVRKTIRTKAASAGLKLVIHTPYYLPTATIHPDLRSALFENLKKSIIFGSDVGADRLTIHPGAVELPGHAARKNKAALTSNLKQIVRFAKPYGIKICLENFNNMPNLLCIKSAEYQNVLKAVPGLGSTFDIGHANTSGEDPVEYFWKIKGYIHDMHIHDNGGVHDQHKNLGEGSIDFVHLFSECRKCQYTGPFILELFPYRSILGGRKKFIEFWEGG